MVENFLKNSQEIFTVSQLNKEAKQFIEKNKDYPRIGRIKYLAEHKVSKKKISAKKIIKWFNGNEPLSGFGKLILGESLIAIGSIPDGIKLINAI